MAFFPATAPIAAVLGVVSLAIGVITTIDACAKIAYGASGNGCLLGTLGFGFGVGGMLLGKTSSILKLTDTQAGRLGEVHATNSFGLDSAGFVDGLQN